MNAKKLAVVTCPKCGMEYLPAEIFLPNVFFGKPSNIVRDYSGKIIDFDGTTVNPYESFTCEKCETPFKISTRLMFISGFDKSNYFEEEFSSPINKDDLFLGEE